MINEGNVWLFADDVSHLLHGKDDETLRVKAQTGIDEMSEWCNKNGLLLNNGLEKYSRKQPDSTPLLRLEGNSIVVDEFAKYLDILDLKVPEWLSTDFIQKCLDKYKDVVITDYSVASAVPPGNNYGSVLYRVGVNYKINDQVHNLSLIIKCPITEGAMKEVANELTNTEPSFYNKFIPEAYKKLKSNFVPMTFNSPIDTVVVMEDLKKQGYLMADRIKQLDFEHCLLYTRAASSFHAVSSVLYKENPELIKSVCAENVYTNVSGVGQLLKNMALWGVQCMAKHIQNEKLSKLLMDSSEKLWDMMIELHKPGETNNCLVQGDPWTTNMMFKYDSSGNVMDIKLIDFQMVSISSPLHDLVTFIWSCANSEVREHRLNDLYCNYIERLNENLKVFNSEVIDHDIFMDHVRRFSPLALSTAAMLPSVFYPEPIDLDNMITKSTGETPFKDNPMELYYTESYCSTELPLLVKHLEAAGVFDYLERN